MLGRQNGAAGCPKVDSLIYGSTFMASRAQIGAQIKCLVLVLAGDILRELLGARGAVDNNPQTHTKDWAEHPPFSFFFVVAFVLAGKVVVILAVLVVVLVVGYRCYCLCMCACVCMCVCVCVRVGA